MTAATAATNWGATPDRDGSHTPQLPLERFHVIHQRPFGGTATTIMFKIQGPQTATPAPGALLTQSVGPEASLSAVQAIKFPRIDEFSEIPNAPENGNGGRSLQADAYPEICPVSPLKSPVALPVTRSQRFGWLHTQ